MKCLLTFSGIRPAAIKWGGQIFEYQLVSLVRW